MTDTITPDRLATALVGQSGIRILSLDCFDTLLWRDVHRPDDLFSLLDGITREQRIRAELSARKKRHLETGGRSPEVTLREIYAMLRPDADAAILEALVAAEIATEAAHCFAFAPTVDLIRAAKARGLRVIIVSDTYLERDQLEALLRAAAGDEVVDMIDRIFTSCDHRTSKNEKLFDTVLSSMQIAGPRVLHIGDNPSADKISAERHGLRAIHLQQFQDATVQRLRQEAAIAVIFNGESATYQSHRATLAIGEPALSDPAEALGFSVLGPIMTTFADWVEEEATSLQNAHGGTIHRLYLMRDGHLPALVSEACHPAATSHRVELSRFTSTAASLALPGGVLDYAVGEIDDMSGDIFLNQLLLTEDEIADLLAQKPSGVGGQWLFDQVVSDHWSSIICQRGEAFADRMIAYLRTFIDPKPDDTIMLIDLGYNGSVQNSVARLLSDRLGVRVAGRYLLLREMSASGLDKKGMIDASRFDDGTLNAMVKSVSILEQMCSVPQGSVIDYSDTGPVRSDAGLKGSQSAIRERAQAGALKFARGRGAATVRTGQATLLTASIDTACATLGRFLTMPRPTEVELFQQFHHDVNLGTTQTVPLFDADEAARNLRTWGLSYIRDTRRMFLPAELGSQGLPVALTHLVMKRFDLNLKYGDFCDASITLPVMIADGQTSFSDVVTATPTHDGYYVAAVPIGDRQYTVGLQFGRLYEWLQVDSATFLPVEAFLKGESVTDRRSLPALPSCEAMQQVAPHLFRCDKAGFLMVPPPDETPETRGRIMMLAVVFRPIAPRKFAVPVPPAQSPALAGQVASAA